jgi:steroid delta-isomerase
VVAYFASFGERDVEGRLALFAAGVVFEDPAGRVVASDPAGLREFWVERIPADWEIVFTLERVAIVGDEALATATMRLRAGPKLPVDVLVNCHLVFDANRQITSFRAFFDRDSITEVPRADS